MNNGGPTVEALDSHPYEGLHVYSWTSGPSDTTVLNTVGSLTWCADRNDWCYCSAGSTVTYGGRDSGSYELNDDDYSTSTAVVSEGDTRIYCKRQNFGDGSEISPKPSYPDAYRACWCQKEPGWTDWYTNTEPIRCGHKNSCYTTMTDVMSNGANSGSLVGYYRVYYDQDTG